MNKQNEDTNNSAANGLAVSNGYEFPKQPIEFQIIFDPCSVWELSLYERKKLESQYNQFKAEALERGYTVREWKDPDNQKHYAQFNP